MDKQTQPRCGALRLTSVHVGKFKVEAYFFENQRAAFLDSGNSNFSFFVVSDCQHIFIPFFQFAAIPLQPKADS